MTSDRFASKAPQPTPTTILSHHADPEAVDSFISWRKKIKKPLTDRAAKMIAKTLAEINSAGGDATEALDIIQERGWLTIKTDWYWRAVNGNGSNSMGQQRPANTNASAQQINDAARVRRSSLQDLF